MSRLAFALLIALIASLVGAQRTPLKLKVGDRISVAVFGVQGYDGEYGVLSDGSVTGTGFGRLVLEGKTLDEATNAITARFRRFMKNPRVTVLITSEQPLLVYVSGTKGGAGAASLYRTGLDLRQILSTVELPDEADRLDARVFRSGSLVKTVNVARAMAASSENFLLQPGDVVTILPSDFVRVWVTGLVAKPGQVKLPADADVYQAIAEAGGYAIDVTRLSEAEILVRRGPNTLRLPGRPSGDRTKLEPGDTIAVQLPPLVRVIVGGEVKAPGTVSLRTENNILQALTLAGGVTPEGSPSSVLLIRSGEVRTVQAKPDSEALQDGDQLFVQRNERTILAIGEVQRAGILPLQEGKTYRLADAVALAGGASERGSLYRVYHGRPGKDGRMQVTLIHLDRFLKDGDVSANPEVLPGDVVLVGTPKGLTMEGAQQAIGSALMLFNVLRR